MRGREELPTAPPVHTSNGSHWGWDGDQGPEENDGGAPGRTPGPPDSGVAALLASLRVITAPSPPPPPPPPNPGAAPLLPPLPVTPPPPPLRAPSSNSLIATTPAYGQSMCRHKPCLMGACMKTLKEGVGSVTTAQLVPYQIVSSAQSAPAAVASAIIQHVPLHMVCLTCGW